MTGPYPPMTLTLHQSPLDYLLMSASKLALLVQLRSVSLSSDLSAGITALG